MPVKIRLARRGRKKQAMYDVVVADSRAPRDGRFIEKIGTYNPNTDPASIRLDKEKAFDWVMKGAQPTDTVRAMLSYQGIMMRKHLQIGVNKGAITQEDADKKLEKWLGDKEAKIQGKVDTLAKSKADKAKAALDAETKVKEARAEALKKKAEEAEAALVAEIKEGAAEGNEDVEEDAAEVEETQSESTSESVEEQQDSEATADTTEVEEQPKAEENEVEKSTADTEQTDSKAEAENEEAKAEKQEEKKESAASEEPEAKAEETQRGKKTKSNT